jgi:hypothetical protein
MAAKRVWSGDSVAEHESASTTLHRVAGFDRNGWPASVGISGRFASESVAGFGRNTHYRTIFPQMTNWLPEEEGAQLRFEFETELARLEAA